jgi:hypothetical protein
MTVEKKMFTYFEKNDTSSDRITFEDNIQDKVLGHGKIAITTNHSILKVLLVQSLDYNLLSVSQLYEMATIICSSIKVGLYLEKVMVPLPLNMS